MRYLIYDNSNGVGVYVLDEEEDALAFAEELADELGDDVTEPDIYLLTTEDVFDAEKKPHAMRLWSDEWEERHGSERV